MEGQSNKRIIIFSILFIVVVTGLTLLLYPFFQDLAEPDNRKMIKDWVEQAGILGVLTLFALQVLQVIIAFIPGEPVELIAGVLYGTAGGLAVCLVGCVLASSVIFLLSKRFGKKLLYRLFKKDKTDDWKWLHDNKKMEMTTFILFFIPGTPKDMLTYFMGVTQMSVLKFICISTLARIPSVVSSTVIGDNFAQGNWEFSLILFIVTGIIGIVGIGFKDKFILLAKRFVKN